MAKAKKLPSGSWNVTAYSHKDASGKRHYESFTAPTKDEALYMAARWRNERSVRPEDMTVWEAIDRYIEAKKSVISPATLRIYKSKRKNSFDEIGNLRLRQIKQEHVQIWISKQSADHKPKTVRDNYTLLSSVLSMFAPSMRFNITLPEKVKARYNLPTDDTIQKMLDHAGKGSELWIAIYAARYYSLRIGEACALTSSDLEGEMLWITKDIVYTSEKQWVVKPTPKTSESYRGIKISSPLLDVLKNMEGQFIKSNPDMIGTRFRKCIRECNVEPFRFHDLRHCFASHCALMGIPDVYTAKIGGWSPTSPILKQVYQNVFQTELYSMMDKINEQNYKGKSAQNLEIQNDMQNETKNIP